MFLENWNQHFQEVNQPGKLNREQRACQNQPIFASIIVCNLKFRSLIHFQFIFTYDGRKCFNFTLLHVANQFFQHQLQKTLSFPYCMFLLLLSQINWPYVSGLFLGSLFCSADLCDCFFVPVLSCFDYYSFVVQSEVRKSVIPSALFFPSRLLLWSFEVSYKFQDYLLHFCEKYPMYSGYFDNDCIKSVDCFEQYGQFSNITSSNS